MVRLFSTVAVLAGLTSATIIPARADNWPVFGYDPSRSGFNSAERTLTVGNVHRLREKWQITLPAVADSTPIALDRVKVGRRYRQMLYQTTKSGITVGIDAMTGNIVWRFTTTGSKITNSTPAADPSGKFIYAPGVDGMIHKLSAGKGREHRGGGFPVRITRLPNTEKDASPLNVANGYLYAVTSGYYGDAEPYDGHVVAVRLSDGKTTVWNSLCSNKHKLPTAGSCSEQRSGIWARGGAVVDPDPTMNGRIYVATGNGDFDANQGGHNYGDSVISLTSDVMSILGSYTPTNYDQLERGDVDLGSTTATMLPAQASSQTPWMLTEGGKDGVLKLINRAAMPGVGGELQLIDMPGGLFSAPAVWTDGSNNAWIFLGFSYVVEAFRLQTYSGVSKLVGVWQSSPGQTGGEGTSPVVANGIVFVAFDDAIVALNAVNGNLLWTSANYGSAPSFGQVHWQSPIVVNGRLYCSDQNGHLTAYALK
jgi:PQQ-like domain